MARDNPIGYDLPPQPALSWLEQRHRAAIVAHLARLDPHERVRRFGRAISDAETAAFVDDIDFRSHWLIGAFSFDHRLIGLAHACPVRSARDCTVYTAISVDRGYRGRGLGRALLGSIVDRLHQSAAATVVAIGPAFELPDDAVGCEFGVDVAQAYEVCTGIRIEAEQLPPGRAYRDTLAQASMP
jgi:GNAT superfamily N-acetyltransferase